MLLGASAKSDLLYNYIPVAETGVSLSVRCRGSDSGVCKGVEPGTELPVTSCAVPTGSLKAEETIDLPCLTEIGANYPEEDMSDVLLITV